MSYCVPPSFVVKVNQRVLRPFEPHAVLDTGKMLSALGRPIQTFDGRLLYPTVMERGGALLEGLAQAHAFQEGNKRTAWLTTVAYLRQNGFKLQHVPAPVAGGMVLQLVNHEIDLHTATQWMTANLEA